MKRLALPFLLCLLVIGGVGVAHGAGTKPTPAVAIAGDDVAGGMPDIGGTCPAKRVCVASDGYTYELDPANDGPVIGFVTKRTETRDGASVEGVVFLRNADGGFRAAGTFVGTTNDPLSDAHVDDELVLRPLEGT